MGNTGITYNQVSAAAHAILGEGGEPSVRAVRKRLGTGSLFTVHKHLAAWRKMENSLAANPMDDPEELLEEPETPPACPSDSSLPSRPMDGSPCLGIVSFSPVDDWYFVIPCPPNMQSPAIVWRLAGWGITQQGKVVGMVAANFWEGGAMGLSVVPPLKGAYKRSQELTEEERALV